MNFSNEENYIRICKERGSKIDPKLLESFRESDRTYNERRNRTYTTKEKINYNNQNSTYPGHAEMYRKMCEEQGKEMDKEYLRSLEFADYAIQERRAEREEKARYYESSQKNNFYGDCDSPYTMENSTATIFYIVAMAIGTFFNARWFIYIVATIIYAKFINRHNKKK